MTQTYDETDYLTHNEEQLLNLISECYNIFCMVVGTDEEVRSADLQEVAAHIHALQDKVLAQAAARLYPEKYRLMGRKGQWNAK